MIGREEKHFFDFNIKCLYYVGLWPKPNATKTERIIYKIYDLLLHFLSLVFLSTTAIGTYGSRHDFVVLLTDLDKTMAAYNFVFKIWIFIYKREQVRALIDEIIASGDTITESHKTLMPKLVVGLAALCTIIVSGFFYFGLYEGVMTTDAWMPFDPLESRMNLFMASQILGVSFLLPCAYRAFAMLGIVCSLLLYLRDQLVDLQKQIRDLIFTPENEEQFRHDFRLIIEKHIRLQRYSTNMESIFKEYFLVQNVAITVELCLNAIMISIVGMKQITLAANFLAFLSIALANAYTYSYLGNELIVQSEGIATAAYDSTWTSWPVDMQKNLLLVMTVAQRPMQLSSGGMAVVSLQNFGQILTNGYSIFAVLSDMVD